VQDLARAHTEEAIRTLVDIMRTAKHPAARVAAAQALLDRGWGKAPQQVDVRPPITVVVTNGGGV